MIDFAEIKPSLWNVLLFGMMALVAIPFIKFVFAMFHVPGLSDLAASI